MGVTLSVVGGDEAVLTGASGEDDHPRVAAQAGKQAGE